MKKKNCALFISANTIEQTDKNCPKRIYQEETLKKFALLHGYNIVGTIIKDCSVKNIESQSYNEIVQLLEEVHDQIDVLLFTRWDRLSRNSNEVQNIIRKLIELNIEFQAVEQPLYFDSLECKLMFEIFLTIPIIK